MRLYWNLFIKKLYIGILLIVTCACLGSFRGAFREEESFWVGVTQEDIAVMGQAGMTEPDLIGVMPLAAEQLHWKNFAWARPYAFRGLVIYCFLILVYMPLYRLPMLKSIRSFLKTDENDGEKLFIDMGNIF